MIIFDIQDSQEAFGFIDCSFVAGCIFRLRQDKVVALVQTAAVY